MKRSTFDDTKDTSTGVPSSASYAPCRVCQGSTPRSMLSQYGAQCHSCYANHCCAAGRGKMPPVVTREQKIKLLQRLRAVASAPKADRAWADALREREARGERLGIAQRAMLGSAQRGATEWGGA